MHGFVMPIGFPEPHEIIFFGRYRQLKDSYWIRRAMCEVRQLEIDGLIITYRMQASGRHMAKFDAVQNLRGWLSRETGRALEDRILLRRTSKWMRARLEEILRLTPTQDELIKLLRYLTTSIGVNGSPTEIYARLEDGKLWAETRRRIAERLRQEEEIAERLSQQEAEIAERLQEEEYKEDIAPVPLAVQRLLEASVSSPDNFITKLIPAGDLGVQIDPSIAEEWQREWVPD